MFTSSNMAAHVNSSVAEFSSLANKLSSLAYIKSENEKQLLSSLLQEFNALNFNDSWHVAKEKAVLVINQCCSLVPQDEQHLKKQVFQLFFNILTKQKIEVEGITLTVAVTWVLECIKSNQEQAELPLLVLQYLIKGKSSALSGQIDNIFSLCNNISNEFISKEIPSIYYNALNCIESLSFCGDDTADITQTAALKCCEFFINNISNIDQITNLFWKNKCIIVNISGISNIVNNDIGIINEQLPDIFGIAKFYMHFGTLDHEMFKIEKVVPSNIALPEEHKKPPNLKKPMGKYDRKSKKKEVTSISNIVNDEDANNKHQYIGTIEDTYFLNKTLTSDSDFSDSEGGMIGKVRKLQTKVRRCCLNLLGNLFFKGETKIMIRFLPSFLPDGTNQQNFTSCLLKDSSPSCRSEVLIVISIVLKKFKQFFLLADGLSKSSFTTISNNVANIITELHTSFIASIQKENYKVVTTHLLKTLSDLIRCTPYHKLSSNTLLNIGKEISPILNKNDVNCQIAALVAYGCIASIEPKVDDVKKVIFNVEANDINGRCWLFNKCSQILTNENGCNPAVAVECLQVLAAIIRNFPYETVISYPNNIFNILEMTSAKHDYLIRFYAAKFLEAVVNALQTSVVSFDDSKKCSVSLAAMIWNKIIFGPVTSLIQCDNEPSLRSIACDCISNIAIASETSEDLQPSLIYDELTRSDQIICITHIHSCTKDETPQVRSSAIRAMAVFVQFARLREDSLFFLDAIDVFFKASEDDNMIVKVQAAWLFGHLAEAIVYCYQNGMEDDLTEDVLIRLLKASIKLSNDTKKGKPYTVRGIANLLTLIKEDVMVKYRDDVMQSIDILLLNASTGNFMKARWNACYAIGIAFSNPIICAEGRSKAFPILFELVQNFKNFKVRINAAHTLSSLTDRKSYGNFYYTTWNALLSGLENAENISDFNEYKHRDHLVDEICSGLCKLVSIITCDDLIPIQEIIVHNIDFISHQFIRYKNRIVPEKSNIIHEAYARLSELTATDSAFSIDQKNSLGTLICTFLASQDL